MPTRPARPLANFLLPTALLCAASAPLAQCELAPIDHTPLQEFPGNARAGLALSLSGDRLAVSSREQLSIPGTSATSAGSVYVHRRDGGAWVLDQQLFPPADDGAAFAHDVALDGDRLAVALPGFCVFDFLVGQCPDGAVQLFEHDGTSWNETVLVTGDTGVPDEVFGLSVALSGDTLVVGAGGVHDVLGQTAGRVYVFERLDGLWTQVAVLEGEPDPAAAFGRAVAVDGSVLAVAAPNEVTSTGHGAVYVHERLGGSWTRTARLEVELSIFGFQKFRTSLAVDGERIAVGSPSSSVASPFITSLGVQAGAVAIVEKTGGSWSVTDILRGSNSATDDLFGSSVALDGDRLLVGAVYGAGQGPNDGAAYLFERTPLGWAQTARLFTPDGAGQPHFATDRGGFAVALEGSHLAFSAPFDDVGGHAFTGSVHTAELDAVPCPSQDLFGAPGLVSLEDGAAHTLRVQTGPSTAGAAYFLLGSASGSQPGIPVAPGLVLPLQFDAYFQLTAAQANAGAFVATLGLLDGVGSATARIDIPGGVLPAALVGATLTHAAAVFEPSTGAALAVSVPAVLALLP